MDLSITIPTYNEKENIPILIKQIFVEFKKNKINGEIIIVDDNSSDGTGQVVEKLKRKFKNLVVLHRPKKMGLSSAVLDGWNISKGDIVGVMDADLSHPPEKISEMFFYIKKNNFDLVIGSRYINGGKIVGWNSYRKIMSKGATLLARVFTHVKDPMTGFFMIKRECIKDVKLDPKGFKLLLEIIIKSNYQNFKEIPITFVNRINGKSKAGFNEIFYYLRNLIGYIPYKGNVMKELFKFGVVGIIGMILNLFILFNLTETFGFYYMFSAFFAFIIAVTSNFILNKIWTFNEKYNKKLLQKFIQFLLVSSFSLLINLSILYFLTEFFHIYYLVSQIFSIGVAFIFNFIGNKIWIFKNE